MDSKKRKPIITLHTPVERKKTKPKSVHFADDANLETIFELPKVDGLGDEQDPQFLQSGVTSATNTATSSTATRATSEWTVLSSAHGRARRELRDVSIFDLQSAVKHGVKTRGHKCPKTGLPRWKYVYGNVVYITDYTSTREVTSYKQSVNIQPADITLEMQERHLKDIVTLRKDPQLCATHTIVVIDQSGSMKASDVPGFKTRSQAAYGVLALEYVAEQLHQRGGDGVLDTISIIEMNDFGTLISERCPLDWIFFNKLLSRQEAAKPKSHGNYNMSLQVVQDLIEKEIQEYSGNEASPDDIDDMPCVAVIFLSDGKPSDTTVEASEARTVILQYMAAMLKSNLAFHAIGLGSSDADFQALRDMVMVMKNAGCEATFSFSELSCAQLSAAFTSVSTSMTATRTEKMKVGEGESVVREKKDVQLRSKNAPKGNRKFNRHLNGVSRWRFDQEKYRSYRNYPWSMIKFKSKNVIGFDIEKDPFGKGAERLAYMFFEIDRNKRRVGKQMVAKESIHIDDEDRKIKFHEDFCRVQNKSNELASKFNNDVMRTPCLQPEDPSMKTPSISFLECSVYEYEAIDGMMCGLLVEDYLLGKFTKYNSNNGYVHKSQEGRKISLISEEVYLTDFVQAFSHWVYFKSNQNLLVCDLQGVLDEDGRYPRFLLTDPCICSKGGNGKKRYGRSDVRMKGIRQFRKNHQCNGVCRGLGLPSF